MATGGREELEPLLNENNEEEDLDSTLIPENDFEMRNRKKTGFDFAASNKKFNLTRPRQKETSFIDTLNEEEAKEEAIKRIKNKCPQADMSKFIQDLNQFDQVRVKLIRKGSKFYMFFDSDGSVNKDLPKTILNALGPTKEEINKNELNDKENYKDEERIGVLRGYNERTDISEEVRNTNTAEIERIEERIEERNQENKEIKTKMFTKERIKDIFKKHGFTIFSIATSVGVIISAIVSNLKSAAASGANAMGNAFITFGKYLGKILPGMIGAIAQFIFQAAGQLLGFLAKNSWLIILFVVTYVIEKFTEKNK